jgi:hypothetical protein
MSALAMPTLYATPIRFLAAIVVSLAGSSATHGAEWESTVDPVQPGPFRNLRPLTVHYAFGWNGFTAASGEVHVAKTTSGRIEFQVTGGTIGFARTLWDYDVKHVASVEAQTLRPIDVKEVEKMRSKHITTDLVFTADGVTSAREERKDEQVKSKTRKFDFPGVQSVNSALLHLRTQSLTDGAVHRTVVYPATSAYLCTATVLGRERLSVPAGTYNAVKLDLKLNKISKERELLPHKKMKKATVWVSDDVDRVVLRIEAQIFIGTVFAELQSIEFEKEKQ